MKLLRGPHWDGEGCAWENNDRPAILLDRVIGGLSAHVAILDGTGRIIGANQAWRRFGEANGLRDPQYCVGANYLAVCEQARGSRTEHAAFVAENLRQLLSAKEGSFQCVYPCHSPTEQRWFQEEGQCFREEAGDFVVIAHHNVSSIVVEGELLRSKLERLREDMPDAFLKLDRDGHLVRVNHNAEKVFGTNRENLLGKKLWDICPATRESQLHRKLQEEF